ncbi:YciI family protein [Nonomuraea sp. NPDC050691]|uniref:YciI family protein n=1 Tax=Nonomuraea sp. NPDC050691 TaxID=3155661 RepID=UPI0033EA0C57
MFVISVHYTAPLERIDDLMSAHVRWLDANYEAGVFLASGRKVPRTGGVILAAGVSREDLDAIVAEDPFAKEGAANHEITEFLATKTAPALSAYRQQL